MGSFVSGNAVLIAVICGVVAVVYGVLLIRWLLALPAGDEKMREVAGAVQEGAKAYLVRQYRTITAVGAVAFVILGVALGVKQGWGLGWETAIGFAVGAILSAAAGFIGMMVSVRVNVRTAEAAKTGPRASALGRFSRRLGDRPHGRRPGAFGRHRLLLHRHARGPTTPCAPS